MDSLSALFARHMLSGIVIDTNILLLYVIGRFDRLRISRFKRTAQFTAEDYELLGRVLSQFRTIRTLPHVLAEVNSLAGQLPSEVLAEFRTQFATDIATLSEGLTTSADASQRPEFAFLGLTDSAIILESLNRYLVMTDDLKLFNALSRAGIDVINFTTLRRF